jgi:hypothetical protein
MEIMRMGRFEKEAMFDELRTIFLFEADHIVMGAGAKAAERFIGIPRGTEDGYCHRPAAVVDLTRFPIADSFDRGYDFAFQPSVLNTLGEHEVHDLSVFMLGTPKAGGVYAGGGETHEFMTPNGLCQTVADTVLARWKLEWDSMGGHRFTTRELALLADMTEGAIRNALADKSDAGLRAIPGTRNPVEVEPDEALRWLKGRRGFIAYPQRAIDDRFLQKALQNVRSAEELGQLIKRRLSDALGAPDKRRSALGWSAEDIEAWQKGAQAFEADKARTLARALGFDEALFAGKALELTIRRDATGLQGGQS